MGIVVVLLGGVRWGGEEHLHIVLTSFGPMWMVFYNIIVC